MQMRAVVVLAAGLAVLLGVLTWFIWNGRHETTGRGMGPAASATDSARPPLPGTEVLPGRCDSQAPAPPLPPAIAPATADLPGVVAALDQSLGDAHKQWIRCFVNDDELLGRAHHGLGRWLRTVLGLWRPSALTSSLAAAGVRNPDHATSVILVAYAHHLRGETLSAADAVARVTAASTYLGGSR
jgi:hypothetical protein